MSQLPKSACPECGEDKRVRMAVFPLSERKPKPIWRFTCRVCGAEWVRDENRPDADAHLGGVE
jgi:rubredoxin